jgi:NAD dependent epimerase/dehydratase family enzyme
MTQQAFITILGIFAGSSTIIIVGLVGFIGKDLKSQIKNLADVIFKELSKKQSKEICDLKMEYAEKENKERKTDIDNIADIARKVG